MTDHGLEVICGCMFSGKTSALIDRVSALQEEGRQVLCMKPAIDDRYSPTDIVTHDGRRLAARAVRSVLDIAQQARQSRVQVVALDEMHFFDGQLVNVVDELLGRGVFVVCSGLDRDMWGEEFPHVAALCGRGRCTRTLGVCRACGRPADRTQRTAPLGGCSIVGGAESFEPRCTACFRPPPEPRSALQLPGIVR